MDGLGEARREVLPEYKLSGLGLLKRTFFKKMAKAHRWYEIDGLLYLVSEEDPLGFLSALKEMGFEPTRDVMG